MAMPDGMLIPVIRGAEKLSLIELAAVSRDLVERARKKKLLPSEYSGATFTVSNLGMFGMRSFAAIIPPPQAGILAVGAAEIVPKWDGTSWVPVPAAALVLSVDHRVADGAQAARFLNQVRALIEGFDPARMGGMAS